MSIQSLNHLLSTLNTTFIKLPYSSCQSFLHLSCLLLRPSLLFSGGHLWDRRDCTSTLPFRVSLPRMLQLCHLHGRVWTSRWRTRVWLWIIHLGDTERKKTFFFLSPCLSISALMNLSTPFKSRCDATAACSVVFEVLYLFKHSLSGDDGYVFRVTSDRLALRATDILLFSGFFCCFQHHHLFPHWTLELYPEKRAQTMRSNRKFQPSPNEEHIANNHDLIFHILTVLVVFTRVYIAYTLNKHPTL